MQKMQEHFSAGREHPVEAGEIDPGLRHQGSQSGNKIKRLENHMGGAVSERGLEFITYFAGRRHGETLFGNGGPGDISTEPFQLFALMGVGGHASV